MSFARQLFQSSNVRGGGSVGPVGPAGSIGPTGPTGGLD